MPPLLGPNLLDDSILSFYPLQSIMNRSLNRYYYYYGPRSSGSDGLAMGCRRAMQ